VVKHLEADYKKPAKLGDMIEVKHKIISMRNTSLQLKQTIWLKEEIIFEMTTLLVFVKEGKPTKVDDKTKEFFLSFF